MIAEKSFIQFASAALVKYPAVFRIIIIIIIVGGHFPFGTFIILR